MVDSNTKRGEARDGVIPEPAIPPSLSDPRSLAKLAKRALKWLWFSRSRWSVLNLPIPCPLPYGGWWLAYGDLMGLEVLWGHERCEEGGWRFVSRFVTSGMTVLDIGANQGFYTILMAQKVGPRGKVIAFEPAPGEFSKLRWNVRINRCRNVVPEPVALSSRDGLADMFVCLDGFGSLSSLRRPAGDMKGRIKLTQVPITTLDSYVRQKNIASVDFMKIDAEGGELEILKGGSNVLHTLNPIIMCEMADVRTTQWGYGAREIYDFLQTHGYEWFSPDTRGLLVPAAPKKGYDVSENLVAVRREGGGQTSANGRGGL